MEGISKAEWLLIVPLYQRLSAHFDVHTVKWVYILHNEIVLHIVRFALRKIKHECAMCLWRLASLYTSPLCFDSF